MMLREGLDRMKDLFKADFTKGIFGIGTTTEIITDIDLELPDTYTLVTTSTASDTQLFSVTSTLSAVLAAGETLSEYGIKNTAGTLFSRSVFTGVSKTADLAMRAKTRFFIRGPE